MQNLQPLRLRKTTDEHVLLEMHVTGEEPISFSKLDCSVLEKYKQFLFLSFLMKCGHDEKSVRMFDYVWKNHRIVRSWYNKSKEYYEEVIVLHFNYEQVQKEIVI